jgi:antirestriction protein ArdC
MRLDIRAEITAQVVAALEAPGSVPPWRKGWAEAGPAWNGSSGQHYRGANSLILGMQPFQDPRYWTFKQADYAGFKVRKGAKGIRIVKLVEVARRDGLEGSAAPHEGDESRTLVIKAYTVFNGSQIEGVPPYEPRPCTVQPAEAVEAIIRGLQDDAGGRLKVNFGASRPAYVIRTDEIRMPPVSAFFGIEDFHSTLLHEAAHASGHPKRLARLHMDCAFGSAEYAREELTAELASAMLQAEIGLPPSQTMMESHAAYVASWLEVLRRDKSEIFKAAAHAQRICDYLEERALAALPPTASADRPAQAAPGVEFSKPCVGGVRKRGQPARDGRATSP